LVVSLLHGILGGWFGFELGRPASRQFLAMSSRRRKALKCEQLRAPAQLLPVLPMVDQYSAAFRATSATIPACVGRSPRSLSARGSFLFWGCRIRTTPMFSYRNRENGTRTYAQRSSVVACMITWRGLPCACLPLCELLTPV